MNIQNIVRNLVLSVCIGGIITVSINMKSPGYRYFIKGNEVSFDQFRNPPHWDGDANYVIKEALNPYALLIGALAAIGMFAVKPIRTKYL